MSSLLDRLPDINFAQKDTTIIEAEVIARFEGVLGRRLFPGDPWRLILTTFVYYLSLQRNNIDFAGKQNLLRYSGDGFLQHIAALVGAEQLPPASAVTTLEFTLTTPLPSITTIRKGTRTTPGNRIYFATSQDAEIPAGELTVAVNAVCTEAGEIGNGFLPGQVNQISDPFPYHCTVINTTPTQGGADLESLEALRARTQIAPESYSTAGPYGAYEYWAKTASQLVVDVTVKSPEPGVVEIVPLLKGGEIPTQSLLDDVYAVCNDDTRRPLTDKVVVRAPDTVVYGVDLTFYVARRDAVNGLNLQNKVTEAVEAFILWQKSKLGRDINPSKLVEMIKATGVKRVDMDNLAPAYQPLDYYQLAVADMGDIKVVYGGLEDD